MTRQEQETKAAGELPLTRAERINLQISVTQTVLALAGIFIGSVALYAALNEADAVRKQLQASVWPHVSVSTMNYGVVGEERFEVLVGNQGIGPAVVESFKVSVDGEYQNSWFEVIGKIAGGRPFGISNAQLNGAVLPANEQVVASSMQVPYVSKELVDDFRELMLGDRSDWMLCYCSVFDECWLIEKNAQKPQPTDACPARDPESAL